MLLREYKHDEGGVKLFVLKKIGNYKQLPFIDEIEMHGISINGYYLHEVQMLMVPSNNAITRLSYSKHMMQFEIVEDKLFLNTNILSSLTIQALDFSTRSFKKHLCKDQWKGCWKIPDY